MKYAVHHSLSRVWRLGREMELNKSKKLNPLTAVEEMEGGKIIMRGKIVKYETLFDGQTKGILRIEGLEEYLGKVMRIKLHNENYIAEMIEGDKETVKCMTPDLITLFDQDQNEVILCENLSYGIRVNVIAIPAPEILTREECLKVVGPVGFGLEQEWEKNPDLEYKDSRSIFDEYQIKK
mmetsp:Transcript_53489/g.44899  ORF Transcript_53489/g.44899 Transcript_53489/m.44899 type:complete len:180 (+) Transcript_53489:2168-2707(+)